LQPGLGELRLTKRKNSPKSKARQVSNPSVATFTSWQRGDMVGGGWTFPPPSEPRRRPADKTLKMLEESAQLLARGRPDWPIALRYWPKLAKEKAKGRLRTTKSKHRDILDALVKKYEVNK